MENKGSKTLEVKKVGICRWVRKADPSFLKGDRKKQVLEQQLNMAREVGERLGELKNNQKSLEEERKQISDRLRVLEGLHILYFMLQSSRTGMTLITQIPEEETTITVRRMPQEEMTWRSFLRLWILRLKRRS